MDVGDIFLFFTLVDMSKYNLIAPVAAKLKNWEVWSGEE